MNRLPLSPRPRSLISRVRRILKPPRTTQIDHPPGWDQIVAEWVAEKNEYEKIDGTIEVRRIFPELPEYVI